MFLRLSLAKQLFASAILLLLATAASAFDQYTFTDLGPVNSVDGEGLAINPSGIVAATSGLDANTQRAYLWQNGLFSFVNLPGDASIVFSINSGGSFCGSWSDSSSATESAFLNQQATLTPLTPIFGTLAQAYFVNDNLLVVGTCASLPDYSDSVATMWQSGIGSSVPGTNSPSTAWGANNAGEVVGETTVAGASQPFTYANGVLTILPLPDFTFTGGAAYAVNQAGDVVGVGFSDGVEHSLLWKNGTITDLGALVGDNDGDEQSDRPFAINRYDQVVGGIISPDLDDDAICYIWENGQITDLNFLTVGQGAFQIFEAHSINDDGQVVGTAYDGTVIHACLLTPIVRVTSLTVQPNSVQGGASAVGTVTLNRRAPGSGSLVSLSSNSNSALVPATVLVPGGATTATFPVTTVSSGPDRTATLTATLGTSQATAVLLIQGTNPLLVGFVLTPNNTFDGTTLTGIATLRAPAPHGGIRVTLGTTNQAVAAIPSSVTIPQGATQKSFTTVAHAPLVAAGSVVTASLSGVSITQELHVSPITLQTLYLATTEVTGGAAINGVISTAIPAPSGGYRVTLASSNTLAATLPASVTIPAGRTSAAFVVTTKPVPGTTFLNITATHGNSTLSRQLQVMPPEVSVFTVSPNHVQGGHNVTGSITLTGKAAAGGVVVSFQANPNLASTVTIIRVPAGSNHVSFAIRTSAVGSTTLVTLYGSTFSVQKTTTLTLTH